MKLLAGTRGVKEKAGGRRGVLLLLALAAALGACARPSLRPETAAGAGAIVQEVPGLRLSVEAGAWHGRPRWLPDSVLPFLVQLRNTGAAPVSVAAADFLLLDNTSRQHLPLSPSEVVTILGGRSSGIGIAPSVGVAGSSAGGTVFGAGLGISLGSSGVSSWDVIPAALPEGPVQPGAQISGFVYFLQPASPYRSLRLLCIPRGLPGPPRLEFLFRRE